MTDDQLKAMERSAPLLVAEVRRLRDERTALGNACDLFKARIEQLENTIREDAKVMDNVLRERSQLQAHSAVMERRIAELQGQVEEADRDAAEVVAKAKQQADADARAILHLTHELNALRGAKDDRRD